MDSSDVETWRERFLSDLLNPLRRFFVAESNDQVIGYGHTVHHERSGDAGSDAGPSGYFLAGVFVSPEHRRAGIGRSLTSVRLEALKGETNRVFYLAVPENEATIALHNDFGFKDIGTTIRDGVTYVLFRLDMDL